jgi:hypothetical protein
MAIAHAEPAVRLPEPVGEGDLRLLLLDRELKGVASARETDADLIGKLIDAPIVLGVREPQEFGALLEVSSSSDRAELFAFADVAMREADNTRAVVLRAYAGPLTVALVTVLDPSLVALSPGQVPLPTLFWSLAPLSGDATARADVLDFLRVLHQEHTLRITNKDVGEPIGAVDGPGSPFDADLERDWRFMTEVAVLEEWSGMLLPVPREVSALEVARIQQAAEIVRRRQVVIDMAEPLTATVPAGNVQVEGDLILEQDFGVLVFGFDVPLGVGRAIFPPNVVARRPDPVDPKMCLVTLGTPGSSNRVVFALEAPPGRERRKRTLRPGEASVEIATGHWDTEWVQGEREADQELRSGQGIRFADEDAFFGWLSQPDRGSAA